MKARHSLLSARMTGITILFLIVVPLAAQAGVQKAVVVDGHYEEWDLKADRSRPMPTERRTPSTCNTVHNGRKCIGEEIPNVYLRYDSITNTVFVLVLQKDTIEDGKKKPVVNIYTLGQNIPVNLDDPGKISHFSWVMDAGHRVGWEGAFQLTPGVYDCDTGQSTLTGAQPASEKKTAAEVEVIDTEGLFLNCK
ncbi:MAG: hypothetical protein WGN25_08105 [Candidatus Electrothrix sp. GW3-4]|uniref:hypothetical protein n=1 Tax=Candidatus Electrothrix sp. GW3-4 TaxID=3126740 RepID=UPI0030CCA047